LKIQWLWFAQQQTRGLLNAELPAGTLDTRVSKGKTNLLGKCRNSTPKYGQLPDLGPRFSVVDPTLNLLGHVPSSSPFGNADPSVNFVDILWQILSSNLSLLSFKKLPN
jgi:hypothetical protein